MNDDEVVDGEVSELEDMQDCTAVCDRNRGNIIRVPVLNSAANGEPTDMSAGDAHAPLAGSNDATNNDLHPLLKARALEFARRHEAMARAYERQMFETITAPLEAIHQPPPMRPAKPPLVARLASSLGEGLIQAGQHLVKAVDSEDSGQGAPQPPRVVDPSTIIVLTEEGDIDD